MKMVFNRIVLMSFFGAALLSTAKAVSYTNELPGYVWDISGDYTEDLGDGMSLDYTVSQDGKGKFSGYGYVSYYDSIYDLNVDMDFAVKGGIKSKDGVYYVTQQLKGKGVVYDTWSVYGHFNASVVVKSEIDTINNVMSGTVTVKALGEQATESFYEPIDDPSMDGTATILIDINDVDGKLLGNGQVHMSNGRIVYLDAKGKADPKKSILKIATKGVKEDPDSAGSKIKLELDLEGILQSIKAKVCGQTIDGAVR